MIPALLARYKLADGPLFERIKQQERLVSLPSFGVLRHHLGPVIFVALVCAFLQMDGYVTGTYFISFMRFAGIPLATIATFLMLSRVADIAGVFVSGPLADRYQRKTATYVAVGVTTLLSGPFTLAILSRRIWLVVVLQLLVSFFGIGLLHGLAPILAAENFPTKFRYSGAGISYGLAGILGGMTGPSLLAGLIGEDVRRRWHFVPLLYGIYCVLAMVALLWMRETRDLSLNELDDAELSPGVSPGMSESVLEQFRRASTK